MDGRARERLNFNVEAKRTERKPRLLTGQAEPQSRNKFIMVSARKGNRPQKWYLDQPPKILTAEEYENL